MLNYDVRVSDSCHSVMVILEATSDDGFNGIEYQSFDKPIFCHLIKSSDQCNLEFKNNIKNSVIGMKKTLDIRYVDWRKRRVFEREIIEYIQDVI